MKLDKQKALERAYAQQDAQINELIKMLLKKGILTKEEADKLLSMNTLFQVLNR